MEIERIGDNTVKLYISYIDMEERGFDREEIWFNRDLGEELFWEMMEEANVEEDFLGDSPLWIQIHALDSGLEMFVTKYSHANKDNDDDPERLVLDVQELMNSDRERVEEILNDHYAKLRKKSKKEPSLEFVLSFADFEDVIQLAKNQNLEHIKTTLYSFDNKYYLQVNFEDEKYADDNVVENALSSLLEYSVESNMTIHRLEEYGKQVISEDVFNTVNEYFA